MGAENPIKGTHDLNVAHGWHPIPAAVGADVSWCDLRLHPHNGDAAIPAKWAPTVRHSAPTSWDTLEPEGRLTSTYRPHEACEEYFPVGEYWARSAPHQGE